MLHKLLSGLALYKPWPALVGDKLDCILDWIWCLTSRRAVSFSHSSRAPARSRPSSSYVLWIQSTSSSSYQFPFHERSWHFLPFKTHVVSHCITLFLIYNQLYSSVLVSANIFFIQRWSNVPFILLLMLDSAIPFMSSLNLSCYHTSCSNLFSFYGVSQCRSFNICCGVLNYGQEKEDFIAM